MSTKKDFQQSKNSAKNEEKISSNCKRLKMDAIFVYIPGQSLQKLFQPLERLQDMSEPPIVNTK